MSTWRMRRIAIAECGLRIGRGLIADCSARLYAMGSRSSPNRQASAVNHIRDRRPESAIRNPRSAIEYAAVYLHDERPREGSSSRYESPRGHLAVVLLRRQDRRAR